MITLWNKQNVDGSTRTVVVLQEEQNRVLLALMENDKPLVGMSLSADDALRLIPPLGIAVDLLLHPEIQADFIAVQKDLDNSSQG